MQLEAEHFVALGFFLFLAVLAYYGVHSKIVSALDGRIDGVKKELAEAQKLREEAQTLLASFETKRKAAEADAAAIVAQARADAEDKLTETDAELAARNDRLKQDNRLLRQRKQALLTQLAQLSSLATETASEFPEDEATGPIPAALVAEPEVGGDDGIDETPEDQDGQ